MRVEKKDTGLILNSNKSKEVDDVLYIASFPGPSLKINRVSCETKGRGLETRLDVLPSSGSSLRCPWRDPLLPQSRKKLHEGRNHNYYQLSKINHTPLVIKKVK